MKSALKWLISPVSYFYMLIYLLRWTLYELRVLRKVKISQPVLSVGNITMGGSGKTPFLLYLLERTTAQGVKAAVVTRAYRASAKKPVFLPSPGAVDFRPEYFGDEACLIKSSFPETPVVTAKRKFAAAVKASEVQPEIVLVDDGFQHWRLRRDLDVVLLDVTEDHQDWTILPIGRAREPFAALGRAGVIVLTKTNLVPRQRVQSVYQRISERVAPELPLICESVYELQGIRDLQTSQMMPLETLKGKKLILFSGVAKPEGFEDLVTAAGLGPVVYHLKLRDHEPASQEDVQTLLTQCKTLNCQTVLMTQKDAVKWNHLAGEIKIFETILSLRVSSHEEQLWKKIDQLYL